MEKLTKLKQTKYSDLSDRYKVYQDKKEYTKTPREIL